MQETFCNTLYNNSTSCSHLSIFCCEFVRSLYHSSPLVLPRPSDICFCARYSCVVSCSGGTTGHLLSCEYTVCSVKGEDSVL